MVHVPQNRTAIFVDYFDGYSAVPHRVELRLGADAVSILPAADPPILWPYVDMHQLPDQAGREGLVLVKGDGHARLCIPPHLHDLNDALRAACPARPAVPVTGAMRKRLVGYSLLATGSVVLILFFLLPLMAIQLARVLPPEGEKALGDATFEHIRVALDQIGGDGVRICTNPAGDKALDRLEARLVKHIELPFPVSLHVLDSELVNAFALPGGHVVLFRGLIEAAESPDEVAAVLAHELGHVHHRDGTVGALRSAGSIGVLGLLFGDFAGGTVTLLLAEQLINARYSQAAETRADTFAHGLLLDAQISPEALAVFFQRLKDLYGDETGLVAHFQSHPELQARMDAARAVQADSGTFFSAALTSSEWASLKRICR